MVDHDLAETSSIRLKSNRKSVIRSGKKSFIIILQFGLISKEVEGWLIFEDLFHLELNLVRCTALLYNPTESVLDRGYSRESENERNEDCKVPWPWLLLDDWPRANTDKMIERSDFEIEYRIGNYSQRAVVSVFHHSHPKINSLPCLASNDWQQGVRLIPCFFEGNQHDMLWILADLS